MHKAGPPPGFADPTIALPLPVHLAGMMDSTLLRVTLDLKTLLARTPMMSLPRVCQYPPPIPFRENSTCLDLRL